MQWNRFGELAESIISKEVIECMLPASDGLRLGERLLKEKKITNDQLVVILSEQSQCGVWDAKDIKVSQGVLDKIGIDFIESQMILPVNDEQDMLEVAVIDPYNASGLSILSSIMRKRIVALLCTESVLDQNISRIKKGIDFLQEIRDDLDIEVVVEDVDGDKYQSLSELIGENESTVVRVINKLISTAINKRVSDVHIEAYEDKVEVRYRIDGVLYPALENMDISHHRSLISRLKVMAELDIAEKRIPQDGRFKLRINKKHIDFRVSVLPGVHGENCVIRILDNTALSTTDMALDQIGLESEQVEILRELITRPYGLILLAGPTGSGKSTTLYSAISEINTGSEKIITIEDPVEYQLEGITQISVNEKKGLTFAKGLRSILRHDPDKILIGEIRDAETAKIAVQSALTGHLVFSTIHANTSMDVIARFQSMNVDVFDLISSLTCVMSQRLIRELCTHCKTPYELTEPQIADIKKYTKVHQIHQVFTSVGCDECDGTGYTGRSMIGELLVFDDDLKNTFNLDNLSRKLNQEIEKRITLKLRESAYRKMFRGETSFSEVIRVT